MQNVLRLLAAAVLVTSSAPPASALEEPHVDAAVQVTGAVDPFRAFASPTLAVDPRDSDTVAVAYGEARTSRCGLQISTNAGLSWTEGASPLPRDVAACVRNTNGPIADLAFSPDGTLYYAFAGYPKANDFHSRIYVARSTDLGRTFQPVAIPGLDPPYAPDMFGTPALPTLGIDPDNPKRMYVAFQGNYGLFSLPGTVFPPGRFSSSYPLRAYVSRSDDGGKTFGQPVPVSTGEKDHATRAYLTVGKDGSLYVFAGEVNTPVPFGSTNPPAAPRIFLSISRDGGRTFTQKVIHTSAPGNPGDEYAVLLAIAPAVDPRAGDLYLVWEDTGRRPPAILFSRSSDNGETWSEPRKINNVDPGRQWDFDEMEPNVAVAPGGRIDVTWLDFRNDYTFVPGPEAKNALQDVHVASSSDGGDTWAADVRVSDRSIDRRLSDVWTTGVRHAVGIVSLNDRAYLAWDDTRNATSDSKAQDVYFTRVRFGATPSFAGAASPTSTATRVGWALGGAALALVLAGTVLFVARTRLSGGDTDGEQLPPEAHIRHGRPSARHRRG